MVSLSNEFACVLQAHSYCHNTGHILCICIYLYEYLHVAVGHSKKNKSSAVAEMGDHLAIIHEPKSGRWLCPFLGGSWIPHLTQCRRDRWLSPHQVASWSIQLFGHNTHGPIIRGLCPFGRAEPHIKRNRPVVGWLLSEHSVVSSASVLIFTDFTSMHTQQTI